MSFGHQAGTSPIRFDMHSVKRMFVEIVIIFVDHYNAMNVIEWQFLEIIESKFTAFSFKGTNNVNISVEPTTSNQIYKHIAN